MDQNIRNLISAHGAHVLGIETSCDDTGVAILRQDGQILSNCVNSQLRQHLSHGGIIPMVAKEYHVNNIDRVAKEAFEKSKLESVAKNISAIAVTNRPGLDYSLQVGVNYAKHLAKKYSKPLIPIHHMQAHALMPLLENRSIRFPFLALLISGGHSLLAICERYNKFHLIGQSQDDAPGELLDKVARRTRLRNLGPPFDRISGGAAIELLAKRETANRFKYFINERTIPMMRVKTCNMSFAGYRGNLDKIMPTIDELWLRGNREKLLDELGHLCGSLQRAILAQVFRKLYRALMYYRMHWRYNNPQAFQTTSDDHLGFGIMKFEDSEDWLDIVVSGGVAANGYLLDKIRECCATDIESSKPVNVYAPSKSLCSDNGLMIAWNGMMRYMDHAQTNICDKDKGSLQSRKDLNETVICNSDEMGRVNSLPVCSIGLDLIKIVEKADFKLPKSYNKELKLMS